MTYPMSFTSTDEVRTAVTDTETAQGRMNLVDMALIDWAGDTLANKHDRTESEVNAALAVDAGNWADVIRWAQTEMSPALRDRLREQVRDQAAMRRLLDVEQLHHVSKRHGMAIPDFLDDDIYSDPVGKLVKALLHYYDAADQQRADDLVAAVASRLVMAVQGQVNAVDTLRDQLNAPDQRGRDPEATTEEYHREAHGLVDILRAF